MAASPELSLQPAAASETNSLSDDSIDTIDEERNDLVEPILAQDLQRLKAVLAQDSKLVDREFGYYSTTYVLRSLAGYKSAPKSSQCRKQAPLHLACMVGHLPTVEILLKEENVDVKRKNEHEETPLAVACYAGHCEIAFKLLKQMSLDMAHDDKDNAPLDSGCPLDRGIDASWGSDARQQRIRKVTMKVAQYLSADSEALRDLFRSTVTLDRLAMLEGILEAGSKEQTMNLLKSRLDDDGWTGLHFSLAYKRKPNTELLLRKWKELIGRSDKSFVDAQDDEGWAALHFAARFGNLQDVEKLLREDANSHLQTKDPAQCDAGDIALRLSDDADQAVKIWFEVAKARYTEIECAECQCWIWDSSQRNIDSAPATQEMSVKELVNDVQAEQTKILKTGGKALWYHLPANKVSE